MPGSVLPYRPGWGLEPDREAVRDVGAFGTSAPGKFSARGFDPARPKLQIASSVGGAGPEVHDAPGGGSTDPAQVHKAVELLSQASAAAKAGLAGATNGVRLAPGRPFELTDHPRFDGSWFCTAIDVSMAHRHELVQVRFSAIALAVLPTSDPTRRATSRRRDRTRRGRTNFHVASGRIPPTSIGVLGASGVARRREGAARGQTGARVRAQSSSSRVPKRAARGAQSAGSGPKPALTSSLPSAGRICGARVPTSVSGSRAKPRPIGLAAWRCIASGSVRSVPP